MAVKFEDRCLGWFATSTQGITLCVVTGLQGQ
jgi:hypothetical protein